MSANLRAPDPGTWAVAATVNEPEELLLAFVAHHLHLGAAAVYLFFDAEQPGLQARLAPVRGCHVTVCDAEWWQQRAAGERPWPQGLRQRANLQWLYDQAPAPWLLHLDADEFLAPEIPISEQLAALPATIDCAAIRVSERVYLGPPNPANIFDGAFRRPFPEADAARLSAIDGRLERFLGRGLTGYDTSKSAVRTGRGLDLGVHGPVHGDRNRSQRLPACRLLHFDGLTPRHWFDKKLRTLHQRGGWATTANRRLRFQFIAADALRHRPEKARALVLAIKQLTPERAAALAQAGLLDLRPLDLGQALASQFPGQNIDLSIARFEAQQMPYSAQRMSLARRARQRSAAWIHRLRWGTC